MNPNIKCLVEACNDIQIKFDYVDNNKNFICINLDKPYYFVNYTTPFNNESVEKICQEKFSTYRLLKDSINAPLSQVYLDPFSKQRFKNYYRFKSLEEIVNNINQNFTFPIIIKKNSGQQGTNVFLCKNNVDINNALLKIYDKKQKDYDRLAIVQEYIAIKKEFRVAVFNQKITMVYAKDITNAIFKGNLSPFHYENAVAIQITDKKFLKRLEDFIGPIYNFLDLQYGGLDIALDQSDDLWLIEINTKPGFEIEWGTKKIVNMYSEMLKQLIRG